LDSPKWLKDPTHLVVKLRELNRRRKGVDFVKSNFNSYSIAMRANRGFLLGDFRPAISRVHQITRALQFFSGIKTLSASRRDVIHEAKNLVHVTEIYGTYDPAFLPIDRDENRGLLNVANFKSLAAQGVSRAAISLVRTLKRKPNELDSKYFRRINKRFDAKVLLLASIAADLNPKFLENLSQHRRVSVTNQAQRAVRQIDMDESLWRWFDHACDIDLVQTNDQGLMMKLIGVDFEGISNTEPEFNFALSQVRKRIGSKDVVHSVESCSQCIGDPDLKEKIVGHTLTISYDFAYKLERQTNFKWSDEPADHFGQFLRRLPAFDSSWNDLTYELIFEQTTNNGTSKT
jgi:hypothetical protein